ncbi:Nramp family divalent metal transporter [Bifidobacterium tibiigranuli]|uniref:Divalent metal cation transporter MntH n=1 Tax=Bifidobacterium tibiigranuli TaxID=2172043 RepID=A0A5N6S866_9BIFI|nr:Nramp family divalent metal transporter [Bifidobacterium tibiigranuli]KAE8126959.1 divalent metal cation transporter [Bifidobacterium tibiigranuli]KAE8129891.1 divalent metal cation transporter [Bifidobacterium tibiigranuli]MCI1649306.1 Nramp family divalent metal transporter [Bifidobacterium tibiigranuli]MCI1674381.1 Nramp family divalent metal transporter [Bifidobacterium tibiigranuli]MCI1713313.1 Nramp family divalent metal transporter [Bifidobacterium tibiigranuli]
MIKNIGETGASARRPLVTTANGRSLEEINSTIHVPSRSSGFWKNLAAFSGPGALVAVGYMDPGNWITSIGGGAQFGYLLMSVILISSLIAMMLQYMCAKLGIVTGLDLAQATRMHTGRKLGVALWICTELAVMATDIAEVIGGAIALNLLFGIPLTVGVALTVLDVLLLLLLTKIGFRKIEAIVAALIAVIVVVFVYEVALARPDMGAMFAGFLPTPAILKPSQLTMALGIVGATVMPHNLYLHSSIVQTRKVDRSDEAQVDHAVRFAAWDSNIQLSVAFVVNCLLLVLGAAMFYGHGDGLDTFTSLYNALGDSSLAGPVASGALSTLFAVALLASGQNSTITGTLTGQIVMEGFIRMHIPLWLRRLVTRVISIIPVLICAIVFGGKESALDSLLVYSQVFLCVALPISMVPLVWLTSSKKVMGKHANPLWLAILAWVVVAVLTGLNIQLIVQTVGALFAAL